MRHMITTTAKVFSAIVAVFVGVLMTHAVVNAQGQPSGGTAGLGQALEIGPPLVSLRGDPGSTVRAQISLRGVSGSKLNVTNQINDFTAEGEDGTPKLLLEEDAEPTAYSIIPWIKPLPRFTLSPKQIQKLNVVISIPQNAPPGGYYGVIRFTGIPPELEGTGVSLSASVGALVFIRVNGDAKESLELVELSASELGSKGWLFDSTPLSFQVRLKNTGNTFEAPKGTLRITDAGGTTITNMQLNSKEGTILPGTIRKFEDVLDKDYIGNKWLFGQYKATLEMSYGTNGEKKIVGEITFWVIHWKLIGMAVIGLIALFVLLRIYMAGYKRRVLKQSRGSRRR